MPESGKNLDQLCVNTIRMLAVDMVEAAKSGHPGMPLGAAPIAYVLWDRFLRFNPANPAWPGRDRFVLSAGHASALIYALLHVFGYDLPLDELKNFRQWESKTPGHPEQGLTPGVEATTGPLGQGFAMGVGMALARRYMAGCFHQTDFTPFDHYVYALVSDGDLMEGVSAEAASLAGTLGLGRLIYLYDDNKISIEGGTDLAFTEDVGKRFEAYQWHVQRVEDANDLDAIARAIENAQAETGRPSLIMVRSHIGYASPKQDQAAAHGEPLGPEATAQTRKALGWPDEAFHIPAEALKHMRQAIERGAELESQWQAKLDNFRAKYPEMGGVLAGQLDGELPMGWEGSLPVFAPDDGPIATRAASGQVINALAPTLTNMVGGSADLAPSNKTFINGSADMRASGAECGRNIHFGVREHAMGAMVNGMALYGGLIPYGGTFLVFSDYMRPALRLAAIMRTNSTFVFTHDSLGVGEDGPTHQPIEHIAALRAIPGFSLIRPADANETAAGWALALSLPGPKALILTRQKLPILDADGLAEGVAKGAYVVSDCEGDCQLLFLATGSEVALALEAQKALAEKGVASRVVSMPCWEVFAIQDRAYQDSVIPPSVEARVGVEAGISQGWDRWLGPKGAMLSVECFGASAPGGTVMANYGFSVDNLVETALTILGQ